MKNLQADYFEFLELPRNLTIDLKDLEKRFYTLSRQLHPDLYARKSADERDYALEASAVLNDAYRALKDPISRALYLLKIEGFDIGEQGTKDVPQELLEEVFELNMALEEDGPESVQGRFVEMREAVDAELLHRFAAWDATHARDTLNEIRALLNRRRYITNLIDKTNVPDRV